MNPLSTKNLAKQIGDKSWFQQLQYATNLRNKMQALFEQSLPQDLIDRYHVLEIQGTELLIGTENAGYAMRIHYVTAQIVESLKQHEMFSTVQSLKCIVMPPKTAPTPAPRKVEPMPESAAKSMKAIANSVEDPDLKAAMLKLARNVQEE
jgi:hypothetical protein